MDFVPGELEVLAKVNGVVNGFSSLKLVVGNVCPQIRKYFLKPILGVERTPFSPSQ